MIDLEQIVKVRWNGCTRKWYESKGYIYTKQNEFFDCKLEDLQKGSTVKVLVICDYCGEEFPKEYRNYFKERKIVEKDCCKNRKCMVKKSKEVNLKTIGVENPMQLKEISEKSGVNHRTPFNEVVLLCEEKGLLLLSKESDYKNDRTPIFIICNKHESEGIQETKFANIKKNKTCCFFGGHDLIGLSKRLNGEDVYNDFIKHGLTPLFKPNEYKDNQTILPYICDKHKDKGIQYRAYMNIDNNEGCSYCAKERMKEKMRFDEKYVFDNLINKGLIPIEGERYINRNTPIKYRCIKHPNVIQHIIFGGFFNTECACDYCRMEKSLYSLNRYFRSSLSFWRKEAENNCNHMCILSGVKQYEVHHLYSYNSIIKDVVDELKLDFKNVKDYSEIDLLNIRNKVIEKHKLSKGICLNTKLHIIFHQVFGKLNNTKEQFEEFKESYYNGEFDNDLEEELKSYNSIRRLNENRIKSDFNEAM